MRGDVSGIYEAGNFHSYGILWPSDHSNFSGSGRFGGTAAADLDVLLFRRYNLRGQTDEEAAANPDAYLFGLFDMDEEKLGRLCKKRSSIIGWLLVILGVWGLYSIVSAWLVDVLGVFFQDTWWLYRILTYDVPRLVATVGIIALGLWFIRGPKNRKEEIPPFAPPEEPPVGQRVSGEPVENQAEPAEEEADHAG